MSDTFAKAIRSSVNGRTVISFRLNEPAKSTYCGIVLTAGKFHIAVREFVELEIAGILLLPKRVIRDHRVGPLEKCHDAIIKETVRRSEIVAPPWLRRCSSIRAALEQLKKRDLWPAIEITVKKDSALFIGSILKVSRSSFFIQCYDATGEWEKVYKLDFKDILRVNFEDSYTSIFNRYMLRHKSKEMLEMQQKWENKSRIAKLDGAKKSRSQKASSS